MTNSTDQHTDELVKDWQPEINRGKANGTFYLTENEQGEFVRITREELENRLTDAALGQSPAELPELIINPADLPATAIELARLIACGTEFLFNGNTPVRVTSEDDEMPRAIKVTGEAVRMLAHKRCVPPKLVIDAKFGTAWTRVSLSNDIAGLYLNGMEGEWGLKLFRGIATAPILSDDGEIRTANGYDAASGLWCHNIPAVTVPERPSQDEATEALALIRSTFKTFPFADGQRVKDAELGVEVMCGEPGLDEGSFLVGLMTAVCRQSLELAPGFLCNAPSGSGAGTGKGLLVKSMCVVSSGAKPAAFTSGHDSEEFDKRLTAAFVEARPSITLTPRNSGPTFS